MIRSKKMTKQHARDFPSEVETWSILFIYLILLEFYFIIIIIIIFFYFSLMAAFSFSTGKRTRCGLLLRS